MSRETFSPKWCPHVSGQYDRGFDADGKPEPTWVELSCSFCHETYKIKCESGAPRQHVLRWASVHLHRDPMKDPFPEQKRG